MIYGITYQNWELAQRLVCHYDLFTQIILLKKALRERTFICFSAASGTLHDDLRMFHCCQWNKLSTKALLCNSEYFCMAASDVWQNHTHTHTHTHNTHTECFIVFLLQKWFCECNLALQTFVKKSPTSSAAKINPLEADSLHVDRRAERHKAYSHSYRLPSKRV